MKKMLIKIKLVMNGIAAVLCTAAIFTEGDSKAAVTLGSIAVVLYLAALILCRPITTLFSSLKSISPELPPAVQLGNKQRILILLAVKILLLGATAAAVITRLFWFLKKYQRPTAIAMAVMVWIQFCFNLGIEIRSKAKK